MYLLSDCICSITFVLFLIFRCSIVLFMWPISPQFQHSIFRPDLELLLSFLDFNLLLFLLELLSFLLRLLLRFRVELDVEASPKSILWTSSARIQSLISLNVNLALHTKLLIVAFMSFQLFNRDAKRIGARTSSLKSISIDDNGLRMVLNSLRCVATKALSFIFKWNNFSWEISCYLQTTSHTYQTIPSLIPLVDFSFVTLWATFFDNVNRITLNTCLSRKP